MKPKIIKKCKKCGKEFKVFPSHYRTKFCNKICYWKSNSLKIIGETLGKKSKGRAPKTAFKKGFTPWNKGKKYRLGDRHWNWKGGLCYSKKYLSWLQNKRNRFLRGIFPKHTYKEWEELKRKFNYTCLSCEKREPEIILTEDHIIPISKEGTDEITNIQPLCKSCNSKKFNKIINYILS